MLNQIVLVGRIIENEEKGYITIAVPRYFKNEEGIYETDYIKCKINGKIEKNTKEWIKKGDTIGIKGRLQTENDTLYVIAEKVTFLSSKREKENENN